MAVKVKKKATSKPSKKTVSSPSKNQVKSKSAVVAKSPKSASSMAKKSSGKTVSAKASPKKAKKVLATKKQVNEPEFTNDEMEFGADDFYSVADGLTITAPSQPLEYKILVSDGAEDLARKVNELLYVAWDGTVWVPLGGVTEVNGKWAQAVARFE